MGSSTVCSFGSESVGDATNAAANHVPVFTTLQLVGTRAQGAVHDVAVGGGGRAPVGSEPIQAMGVAVGPSVAAAGAVPAVEVGPAAPLGPATRLFQDLAHAFAVPGNHEVGFHFHPVQLGGYVPTSGANAAIQ